jgi:hypothetical protein
MKFDLSDIIIKIRSKGFIVYILSIASVMMILLSSVDLIIEFFYGTFQFQNFLRHDLLVNLIISLIVPLGSWFMWRKQLILKPNITGANFHNNNGKKEK